ncbi:hypothetical protein [Solimonas marina]|uniref:hypothetical protein n=1 Tax=Solimonas marina TaxID=2714601 RepID=UPI0019D00E4B|nr:hypothetical protein [Solimonas marina]
MKSLQRLELFKDIVQQAIDRGTTSVEAIHQHIAGLPFDMLEKSGLLDDDKLRLKAKQQRTIGAIYETIRRVNQQVGELISDQFELLEDSEHIRRVMDAQDGADDEDGDAIFEPAPAPAAAPAKKKAAKKAAVKKAAKKATAKKATSSRKKAAGSPGARRKKTAGKTEA